MNRRFPSSFLIFQYVTRRCSLCWLRALAITAPTKCRNADTKHYPSYFMITYTYSPKNSQPPANRCAQKLQSSSYHTRKHYILFMVGCLVWWLVAAPILVETGEIDRVLNRIRYDEHDGAPPPNCRTRAQCVHLFN